MRDLEWAAFWALMLRVALELAAICANCAAREVAMATVLQDFPSPEDELNVAWSVLAASVLNGGNEGFTKTYSVHGPKKFSWAGK